VRTLALASGGIAGLLYQIGVLEAFDDMAGEDGGSTSFDYYIGVGSGAALAALLANGIPPREAARALEGSSKVLPPFDTGRLLRPNCREMLQKGLTLPRALWGAVQENLETPAEVSWQDLLLSLTGVLPSGLYVTSYIEEWMREALSRPGRSDRFQDLRPDLFVVASDVDSGQSVVFGSGDLADVPISRAVAATAAVPMLFAPVDVRGRHYVDGTTNKMLHLSLPLDLGTTFIFCVTPFRPLQRGAAFPGGPADLIADEGVVSVAKQALRTLLHSRLVAGLEQYSDRKPRVDILLVEPPEEDAGALFYNVGKARTRALLREAGYVRGREEVARMAAGFAAHGISVRRGAGADVPGEPVPARLARTLEALEDRLPQRARRPAAKVARRAGR
jgi:predicted acylesterase/phospholipase RssA